MDDNNSFLEEIPVIWDPTVLGTENDPNFQLLDTETDVRANTSSRVSSLSSSSKDPSPAGSGRSSTIDITKDETLTEVPSSHYSLERENSLDRLKLRLNIANEICLECGAEIRSGDHEQELECGNCYFRTWCKSAMEIHPKNPVCKPDQAYGELPSTNLWLSEGHLACKCGNKCVNPNRFARHLAGRCATPSGRLVLASQGPSDRLHISTVTTAQIRVSSPPNSERSAQTDFPKIDKETPKKDVVIDITEEESSNSSDSVICETPVHQKKLETLPRLRSPSSKNIEDLGAHIREDPILGPTESDNEVIELSDGEEASSSDSSSEEDDEIQIITPVGSKETGDDTSLGISITRNNSNDESRGERRAENKRQEELLEVLRRISKLQKDLNVQIQRALRLIHVIILETPEEEEKLPELSDHISDVIDQACDPGLSLDDIVTRTLNDIEITHSDIRSLEPTQWLNDNIINSYLDMIAARSKSGPNSWPSVYVFTTFFYPKYLHEGYSEILKRFTYNVDLFSFHLLMFPIHLENHWCLAVADLRDKTIKYYDSLGGKNFECPKAILQYLQQEHQDRKKSPLNDLDWKLEIVEDIPQQENGADCGMFACKFAEYLSRDATLTFKQEDMSYYRKRMIYEIVAQDLLYP